MFREMRRKNQQIPHEEAVAILQSATSGTLALQGDDGYPYAVPMSHYYSDGKLYFHCAAAGYKLDCIARSDKASFCVIAQDEVHPEKFTTFFRSVVAFGRIRVIEDEIEKVNTLRALSDRFVPNDPVGRDREIFGDISAKQILEMFEQRTFETAISNGSLARVRMLEMTIEHLTGKEARELMTRRG